ncbi:hypothetical protein N7495_008979 [Penicillium taxi]|uniref:uncharacterized protein n=1 Tax=Penicillium taxi TaxID=168475 RepID=UPI0025450502|nr:uncharacterized protein N7495_008979 [Penicillium taxi]KAJ5888938.1 hypothetical protein N7495_008979 [Penicillium taxi]
MSAHGNADSFDSEATRKSKSKSPFSPQLFGHLPDRTEDALATFQQIKECSYAHRDYGYTEHAMECDCSEEWNHKAQQNLACGEDSDCINRATKIECLNECGCGDNCLNQRMQKKQYAKVAVIQTEKKGFGLRAETDLEPHQLIYEYVGEVLGEKEFRRRMRQYDDAGIKHFYFMSLSKGEFVDATKKGNLGRFCNHSCNPNCYVDKWVIGEKLRMGIFTERAVQAGEELVFNYNVDRYGADPQPCYCGERNCSGFIGGRTQTERATKLSNSTIEALGIDDDEGWDTVVSRRFRPKKLDPYDEEYVDSVQLKSLDEDAVTKVMTTLMQCQEKWIAVKLLGRVQRCETEKVSNRVIKMHGYQILKSQLTMWADDTNVVLQILDILERLPCLTRNKIIDSKIETAVKPLASHENLTIRGKAEELITTWANLEVGYRIPRMTRDNQARQNANTYARRDISNNAGDYRYAFENSTHNNQPVVRSVTRSASRSASRSVSPDIETTRNRKWARPAMGSRRQRFSQKPLPYGWFVLPPEEGRRRIYYGLNAEPQHERPTAPDPGPDLQKVEDNLQRVMAKISEEGKKIQLEKAREKMKARLAREALENPPPVIKEDEKWKRLPLEKQKKVYENTMFPYIKVVVDQYKHKIPKEHLKRFAKETATKLVEGDYKKGRVTDPTKISEKHQHTIKAFCRTYFDKAAAKQKLREESASLKRKRDDESAVDIDGAQGETVSL